jgi:hypothetical protein
LLRQNNIERITGEEKKKNMSESNASDIAADAGSFDSEVASSPPRPLRTHKGVALTSPSSPGKSNSPSLHDSESPNDCELKPSAEHETADLEESSTQLQQRNSDGKSLLLMVHNMLQHSGEKAKEDFAKGVVVARPDDTLQQIYATERTRSSEELIVEEKKEAESVGDEKDNGKPK